MNISSGRVSVAIASGEAVIRDPVFGEHRVADPVLTALLATPSVMRLQRIHQAGASYLVRERRDLSRYDHSVGVFLGIRRSGGSLEEQIAGLLHDVSHTAFSHVVDHALANADEDFHERQMPTWIANTEIPAVLTLHDIDARRVLDAESWSLLNLPAPDLCMDRIDYTLRDLFHAGRISSEEVEAFLGAVVVSDRRIVIDGLAAALWFVRKYHEEVTELFMDPIESYANACMGEAIRRALEREAISLRDLFLDDETLLAHMRSSDVPDVHELLERIRPSMRVQQGRTKEALQIAHKYRVVDPVVQLRPNVLARCSELDERVIDLHNQVSARSGTSTWLTAGRVDPKDKSETLGS